MGSVTAMHMTKKELRALPHHALINLTEQLYLQWRFSGSHSGEEGEAAANFSRVMAEVDRRRRRRLRGRCTCELCFELVTDALD